MEVKASWIFTTMVRVNLHSLTPSVPTRYEVFHCEKNKTKGMIHVLLKTNLYKKLKIEELKISYFICA